MYWMDFKNHNYYSIFSLALNSSSSQRISNDFWKSANLLRILMQRGSP